MANGYKAQAASFKSRECVLAKDKEGWVGLFAEDAIVQDPVGESPIDPSGKGIQGREAIAEFFDLYVAPGEMDFHIESSFPAGDECANKVVLTKTMEGGISINNPMVVVYTANDAGEITLMRAFWEYSKVEEQIKQQLT